MENKASLVLNKIKNSKISHVVASCLIYFFVRINQTDFLKMVYYRNFTRGTLAYTVYDYLFPYEISSLIILIAIILLTFKMRKCKVRYYDILIGTMAGLFSIWGISFRLDDTWNLTMGSRICMMITIIYVLGSICVFAVAKGYVMQIVESITTYDKESKLSKVSDKQLYSFIFISAIWMIWLVFRYPGGLQWDELRQIDMILDHNLYTQHWPIMTTLYYGGLVNLGKVVFGSDSFGLFLAILIQLLYCAFVASFALKVLKKLEIKCVFRNITLLIFALNPIIARFVSTASKDSLYAFTLLWVCSLLTEFLFLNESGEAIYIEIAIASILLCLVRKNGNITILPIVLLIAVVIVKDLLTKKTFNKSMALVAMALLIGIMIESITSNAAAAMGIPKGPFKESLSVPLQQTARLARDYSEVVTDEDKEILGRVIDFDYIAGAYDPKISDPVKDTYYGENMGDFVAYLKIWTKYLFKAPSIYIQAFLHMNGDFVDVNSYFIELSKIDPEADSRFMPTVLEGKFRVFTDFYEGFPLVWPLCNVGIQSWLAIYMLFVAFDRKSYNLSVVALISVLTICVCLMGPTFVNKGIRYLLPIMVINPFLVNLFINEK